MKSTSKKRYRNILIGLILILGLWLLLPFYLREALTHWFPEIDDHQIFNNRIIEASHNVFLWPEASNYNQQELKKEWKDTLEHYKSTAYLVIQNDSIIYEEYWDDYSATTPTNSFSVAKSIVSLLVGAAIDEGKISSLDQKVGDFIPHFNTAQNKHLTIRHLLTMSSGSNWDEAYTSPLSLTTQAYYGNNLEKLINKINITEESGKHFSYKSGDTQILAHVISAATQKTLSGYASEKLWQPLGAKEAATWSLDHKNGQEKAYCCFNSNARDFALIGALVLHDGYFNNQQIISSNYVKEAIQAASYLLDENNKAVDFYGYQWWIATVNGKSIPYARGILGQYIFVLPHYNAIIVRLGHNRSKHYRDHHPIDIHSYLQMGMELMK